MERERDRETQDNNTNVLELTQNTYFKQVNK